MKRYLLIFILTAFYANVHPAQANQHSCNAQSNRKAIKMLFQILSQDWAHQATKQAGLKKLEVLLKTHPEIANAKNRIGNGDSALMAAVRDNKFEAVKLILQYHPDVNVQNALKETALMQAAKVGSARLTELLLRFDANPDMQDDRGQTALMRSMYSFPNSQRIIEILLAYYADPDIKDIKDQTAFTIAGPPYHKRLEGLIVAAKEERVRKRVERLNEIYFEPSQLYDPIQDDSDDDEEKKIMPAQNDVQ